MHLVLDEIAGSLRERTEAEVPAALSAVETIDPAAIPEPSRSLLVHNRDMTGTLARFWGQPIHIEPLLVRRESDALYREVTLVAGNGEAARRVEAGAIRISLGAFPEEARRKILANREPFGGILNEYGIAYDSRPRAYFRTLTNAFLRKAFPGEPDGLHYGRHNVLTSAAGAVLAEVVEILPAAYDLD